MHRVHPAFGGSEPDMQNRNLDEASHRYASSAVQSSSRRVEPGFQRRLGKHALRLALTPVRRVVFTSVFIAL